MVGKRKKIKNRTAGFTLAELVVAVAILAVATVPIMSALVVTSRLNLKGRRKEQALTVAQNVVEGAKAFGITALVTQCDATYTGDFTIIPENSGSTKISHSITKKDEQTYNVDITGYDLMNGDLIGDADDSGYIESYEENSVIVNFTAIEYEFTIENILMGSTYYDAVVSVVPSTDKFYVVSYYYEKSFTEAGMSNLKYYDVEVNVTLHDDDTEVLATYTGSFLDQD